jgi:hypothetical protein
MSRDRGHAILPLRLGRAVRAVTGATLLLAGCTVPPGPMPEPELPPWTPLYAPTPPQPTWEYPAPSYVPEPPPVRRTRPPTPTYVSPEPPQSPYPQYESPQPVIPVPEPQRVPALVAPYRPPAPALATPYREAVPVPAQEAAPELVPIDPSCGHWWRINNLWCHGS